MGSVIDLEAEQVAQAVPRAGAFSLFLTTEEVVTARKEEVGGAETHEMNIIEAHASSAAGSLPFVSTGQDINDEAQSVIPQIEGVTSI
jgi:hypothetical protein